MNFTEEGANVSFLTEKLHIAYLGQFDLKSIFDDEIETPPCTKVRSIRNCRHKHFIKENDRAGSRSDMPRQKLRGY